MEPDAIGRLSRELDTYQAMIGAIAELRKRDDAARLHDLVRLRRELACQFPKLRESGLAAFAARPALLDDFRSRLSELQHRVLLLQADWPAVSINDRLEDYGRAASDVSQANWTFIRWLRNILA